MPKTLNQKVADLKHELENGEDFGKVLQMFFQLSDEDSFMALGSVKEDEILEQLLAKIVEQFIKQPVTISAQLVYVKEYQMYHGSFIAGRNPGVVVYFEQSRMGLVYLNTNMAQDEGHCLRFSADILLEGMFPGKSSSFQND